MGQNGMEIYTLQSRFSGVPMILCSVSATSVASAAFFGNDEIFGSQNPLDARLADAVAQQIGCDLRRTNTRQHPPRRTVAEQLSARGNDRRSANHFRRLFFGIMRGKLQSAACRRLFGSDFNSRFGAHSVRSPRQFQSQFGRCGSVLFPLSEFLSREKDHAERLNIVYVDIPVQNQFHGRNPFPSVISL